MAYNLSRIAFLIVTCIIALSMHKQVYAQQPHQSSLGTVFSATIWGAGIGIVGGMGLAAINTPDEEEEAKTGERVRNNIIQGFGFGVLSGLLYGMFEVSDFGDVPNYSMSYNYDEKQTLVTYNHKF